MTTVRDIVEGSLRLIGVVALDEAATADEAATGLVAYNDMISAWALDGITLDPVFTDQDLADTFPMTDRFREGVKHLLASRLSPNYGTPVSFDADDFFRKMQAAYTVIPDSTIDAGLLNRGRTYSGEYYP